MSGLVKSPLQTAVVEGIYNDILTKNARYYYFLGKTDKWTEEDGASPGEDGVLVAEGDITVLVPPEPQDTFRYELKTRNNILTYKLVKSSDVAFIIPRHNWTNGTVYDMYDDTYSITNPSYSGATRLEDAVYYVLTSLNNVYKCISNNYDAPSTVEPSGTDPDEFTSADGYIWQFMYNIPVALQNKFYTAQFIPVMTSLRNKFYENGAISTVAIEDPGADYTENVVLAVSGDGYLENNPYAVGQNCIQIEGGSGYKTTVAITAASWVGDVGTFTSVGHGFLNDDLVTIRGVDPVGYNGNYTVTNKTDDTFDVVLVGDPGAYVSGGSINMDITLFSAPRWGGSQIQSTGYITVDGSGVITALTCDPKVGPGATTVYGYGYDNTGTVTIDPPFVHDYTWSASATYLLNDIIKANDNFYEVTVAGTVNATLPIHTAGAVTFGTCELTYIGTQAKFNMALTKTEAIMSPIVQGGQITGVTVDDGGVGYTYCTVSTVDSPINTSAILTPDLSIGNIDTLQADVELAALGKVGSISYIKMEYDTALGKYKTGSGYSAATAAVTITGDGSGATAVPVIVNGEIVAIEITNHGTGYKNEAIVTITPDNGARARAIFAPSRGHGSNAIREFNSNTIMFYSMLADERIHGLQNLNDYRQFGVIKNPNRYGITSRLTSTVSTPCWLVNATGTINITEFVKDDIIHQGGDETYKVIEISGSKMVIQAFNQVAPTTANFINATTPRTGNTLAVSTIVAPQVDKFSGDLLFVDNKLPFVATQDQLITFRTTIGFE